jgi:sulfur carrier protein ThiS
VELARARASVLHSRRVAPGTLVREVVRSVGQAPEGSAVLVDGVSVPLDLPIERPVRLVVVPTFSGG